MTKLIPTAFLLAAMTSAVAVGDPPAQQHIIYIVDHGTVKPADPKISSALKEAIADFIHDLSQIRFAQNGAELSYRTLTIETWKSGYMELQAIIEPPASREERTPCSTLPCAVDGLFRNMVEDTLFTGPSALYRPLPIQRCHVDGDRVDVTVTPVNDIGLELALWYRVRDGSQEWPMTLKPRGNGVLTMSGAPHAQASMRERCDLNQVTALSLQPHLMPLAAQSLNASRSAVTH